MSKGGWCLYKGDKPDCKKNTCRKRKFPFIFGVHFSTYRHLDEKIRNISPNQNSEVANKSKFREISVINTHKIRLPKNVASEKMVGQGWCLDRDVS